MPYIDKGSTATDNEDGDLTNQITITGESDVDLTTPGVYDVVHSVTDSNNGTTTKVRHVHVVDDSTHDFVIEITATGPVGHTAVGTGYVSSDGGLTFTPLIEGAAYSVPDGDIPVIVTGNFTEFAITTNPGNITKMHIVKATALTSINSFVTSATNMQEFTVDNKDVFSSATSATSFLYGCTGLLYLPEINYSNITDVTSMLYNAASLKCIAGTIDFSNVVGSGNFLRYNSVIVAPNVASVTALKAGGIWTNPGVCDITTQDAE